MQNTERLGRRIAQPEHQTIDREERLRRELAREWAHDPSARWLLALDRAIRRAAWAMAGFFGRG